MVAVIGPDVSTSCGNFGRRLVLGSSYVVGVGGACSPIGPWSLLSTYSSEELELLRSLDEMPCDDSTTEGTAGTTGSGAMGVAPAAGLLGVMMALIVALQE